MEGTPPRNKCTPIIIISLLPSAAESILAKCCAYMLGRVLEQVRGGEKKKSAKGKQKPWRTVLYKGCKSPLCCTLSHQEGHPYPFSLGVCFCLASVLNKRTFSLLFHFLRSVSNNKLCTYYSFCLLEIFLLSVGVRARATLLPASSLWCLVMRSPDFHPGYSGPIPGQGTKISLQDCSLLLTAVSLK